MFKVPGTNREQALTKPFHNINSWLPYSTCSVLISTILSLTQHQQSKSLSMRYLSHSGRNGGGKRGIDFALGTGGGLQRRGGQLLTGVFAGGGGGGMNVGIIFFRGEPPTHASFENTSQFKGNNMHPALRVSQAASYVHCHQVSKPLTIKQPMAISKRCTLHKPLHTLLTTGLLSAISGDKLEEASQQIHQYTIHSDNKGMHSQLFVSLGSMRNWWWQRRINDTKVCLYSLDLASLQRCSLHTMHAWHAVSVLPLLLLDNHSFSHQFLLSLKKQQAQTNQTQSHKIIEKMCKQLGHMLVQLFHWSLHQSLVLNPSYM